MRPSSRTHLLGSAIALIAVSPMAMAQSNVPASPEAQANQGSQKPVGLAATVEDVVVTAPKTIVPPPPTAEEQRLIPTGQTVLNKADLTNYDIRNVHEVTTFVPNVYQPQTSFSNNSTNYFIRGIGRSDGQMNPTTMTTIDGISSAKQMGSVMDLLDVDRVDVIRGPTGFTGGRIAEGGTVAFKTIVPDDQFHGRYEVGGGSYADRWVSLFTSGPLSANNVYGSIAFNHRNREGTDVNQTLGVRVNNIETTTGRVKLRFTPTDAFDIRLSCDGDIDNSSNRGFGNLLNANRKALYNPVYPRSYFYAGGCTSDIYYKINSNLTLNSLSGIRTFRQNGFYDNSGDVYGRNATRATYRDNSFQQELKLLGDYGAFKYTAGLFWYTEDWHQQRRANTLGTTNIANPALSTTRLVDADFKFWTQDIGVFGESSYQITPKLLATAGVRFDHQQYTTRAAMYGTNDTRQWQDALNVFYNAPMGPLAWAGSASTDANVILPKIGLTYSITPEVAVFASFRDGMALGGYDFQSLALTSSGLLQSTIPYKPERLLTYEAGIKTNFPDFYDSSINVTGFYNSFENVQLSTLDPSTNLSRYFNAGNAHSAGVELEIRTHPVDRLELLYSASYLTTRLDTFTGIPSQTSYSTGLTVNSTPFVGAQLPLSPRFQTTLGLSYVLPLSMPGTYRIAANAQYQASSYADALNNALTRIPSQTYVNASVSWTSPDTRWMFMVSAKNLLNERYSQRLTLQQSNGVPFLRSTFYNDPMSITASLRYTY